MNTLRGDQLLMLCAARRHVRAAELYAFTAQAGNACDHVRRQLERHGAAEHRLVAEGALRRQRAGQIVW